jgi:hypothetical protein
LAAFHDLADPGFAGARAETLSRLPPISALRRPDVPQRAVSARPAGHRRRLDLHFLADARRLHHPSDRWKFTILHQQAVYSLQGTAGNIPLAAAFTVVPIVVMGIYFGSPGAWGPSMRSDRSQSAPFGLKIAAAAGLIFLHLPILLIFVYAFTTEEKPTSGRRRLLRSGSASPGGDPTCGALALSVKVAAISTLPSSLGTLCAAAVSRTKFFGREAIRCWSFCR